MDYLRLGGTAFAPTGDMRRAGRSRAGRVVVAAILAGTATVSWGASDSPMTGELEPSGIRQLLGSKSPGSPSGHPIIAETLQRFYEGRLKFMFSNRFGVYLHDTPATELFDGADRARSHGCVRVERPLALAAFALSEDPRWDRDAIEKAVANGERRRIDLPRELPVYLLYWTAWGEPDGGVSFREDLYGFDERLTLALMGLAP